MPTEPEEPTAASLSLERVLHALSDPIRLDIVRRLARDGCTGCSALDYPLGKSTVSHHLRTLRLAGLTHTDLDGTSRFLTLRADDIEERFPGLLTVVGAPVPPPVAS